MGEHSLSRRNKGRHSMKDKEESPRIESILLFISDYIYREGMPPTIREIGDSEGISSTSTVNYWLGKLMEYGYLGKKDGIPRSVRLTPAGLERIGLDEITVR
jgi:repressor LexA